MWEWQVTGGSDGPSPYDAETASADAEAEGASVHAEAGHDEDGAEKIIEGRAEQPHFARALRGYDRDQVDNYVAEYARWGSQALIRIEELETKVSGLEGLAETSRRYREEADEVMRRAEMAKAEAEERATALVDEAHARAGELRRATEYDREEAD